MRRCFITLLLLAGCAAPGVPGPGAPGPVSPVAGVAAPGRTAASGPSLDARLVGSLPETFNEMRRYGEVTDYEARQPGLGASARYVPANGERILVTLYSYDRGQRRQPEGGSSPDIASELRLTGAELNAMVQMGRYRSSTPASGLTASTDGDPAGVRCVTYRLVQGDGAPTGDAVCVTVWNGRFLKSRVTMWNPAEPTAAGLMASILLVEMRKTLAAAAPQRVTMLPAKAQLAQKPVVPPAMLPDDGLPARAG